MTFLNEAFTTANHPTTGNPISRATNIMSKFDFDPKIVAEIYDAVLVAKGKGISQSEVFAQFVKKYNISADLQAKIESVMASTH
ncbi:MAG: hypothetical protein ACK6AD_14590 [Cyanobacteriota bacterium]|jgi:hypothetical protein